MKGKVALVVLAVFAALPWAASPAPAQPAPPNDEAVATIHRDAYGVPHVFGPTDASVVFGAAWVQAEEDWPAIERNFVRAIGRGTELTGREALVDDYLARALEIPRLAREEYAASSPHMRRLLEAYANGFNRYLEAHPGVERRVLERVEPWHTLALIKFKYHQLEYLAYAGFRGMWAWRLIERGWPAGGERAPAVIPASGPIEGARGLTRFAGDLRGALGVIPWGSNEWAVGPSRTAEGHAMLLVNPHQSFFGVERYLEIHLDSEEGLVFSGLTRFGFLLPYMGNNAHLGWTYTDNYADIGDLYVERFDDPDDPLRYRYGDGWRRAETWTETIRVRSGAAVEEQTLRFWKTHHGPVVGLDDEGRPLAARLAKLEEGGWFAQLDAMIRSRTLEEFRAAMGRLGVAYMNTMYADREGNIGYVYTSAVPRRDAGYDWSEPVDGSDPGTEWDGYHELDELPQVFNPTSGWLMNTNSSPLVATRDVPFDRDDFPSYMIGRETDNARAKSSRRVLERVDGITFDDFSELVWDSRLSLADSLLPVIEEEWARLLETPDGEVPPALRSGSSRRAELGAAVDRLVRWDRRADVESSETTLFVFSVERWFANRSESGEVGRWSWLEAIRATVAALEERWGTSEVAWGTVNRLQRPPSQDPRAFADSLPSLPVGGAPGGAGSVFSYHTALRGSVGVRYGVGGNSFVKVIEFAPVVRGRSVLVFGQSGDPDSPHFFDQAPLYSERAFKPAWFTREEVETNAVRTYTVREER